MPPLSQIFSEPKMPDNLRQFCRPASGMPPLNVTELSVDMVLWGAREREEQMERTNIDGESGIIIRYKWHDVYVVGVSIDEETRTITINQLQGVRWKKSYRVATGFDLQLFIINFCRINFTEKGWKMVVKDDPTWIEKAVGDTAFMKYIILRSSFAALEESLKAE